MKDWEVSGVNLNLETLRAAKEAIQKYIPEGPPVSFGNCPECEFVYGGENGPTYCPKCFRNYYWRNDGDEKFCGPKYFEPKIK